MITSDINTANAKDVTQALAAFYEKRRAGYTDIDSFWDAIAVYHHALVTRIDAEYDEAAGKENIRAEIEGDILELLDKKTALLEEVYYELEQRQKEIDLLIKQNHEYLDEINKLTPSRPNDWRPETWRQKPVNLWTDSDARAMWRDIDIDEA